MAQMVLLLIFIRLFSILAGFKHLPNAKKITFKTIEVFH